MGLWRVGLHYCGLRKSSFVQTGDRYSVLSWIGKKHLLAELSAQGSYRDGKWGTGVQRN